MSCGSSETIPQQSDGMEPPPCDDLLPGPPEHVRASSSVCVQSDVSGAESPQQTLKVFLRVRPLSNEELSDNEEQGCVVIEDSQVVKLHAPKNSAALKCSERGIGVSVHQFSFSQIFGPETTQNELFEQTVRSQVSDYLHGKNALIFSYGVTNAGKTYTIQGTPKEPGILPRVLESIFQHIRDRRYAGMDLKPHLGSDVQCLGPEQVKHERSARTSIFASFRESEPLRVNDSSSEGSASSIDRLPSSEMVSSPVEVSVGTFTLWVAFFEIYNESVFDLLRATPCSKTKKRAALRVCEDRAGNTYVRDLKWINIHNLEEASKLLRFGNKNRSAASTKMNHSSSRSHSIFTMKLLKITGSTVDWISEFSLCDLAGSERCNKAKTFGERLKEAGNINNSLLILGKCITALRNNHTDRSKGGYIPFRESKLTKLFQAFFCGKGKASMIININRCASTYDETLHVMKFSAVAKQVIQVMPVKSLAPCLVGRDGNALVRNAVMDSQALESCLSEDELLDEDDEADVSILSLEELLTVIEMLRTKLLAERRKNLLQEMEIRKEMGDAMMQQLMQSEELLSQQMVELKESYDEKLENTFEMYKDAIKEHAYQCAMDRVEDDYVPVDEFIAEQEKVEALRHQLSELRSLKSPRAVTEDRSCQTVQNSKEPVDDVLHKYLYKEKCAVEKMCEDKQELIMSLERRLAELKDTLNSLRDDFMDKSAELELMERKAEDQARSIDELLRENISKDGEIASLKEQITRLSQKSPVKTKAKRGLLANIRDTVSSPRTAVIGRTLRKTVRATSVIGDKHSS